MIICLVLVQNKIVKQRDVINVIVWLCLYHTLQEVQYILFYSRGFAMVYFEAYINDQYIWHKNNMAQLCCILGVAELCWKFSSWLRDIPDIHIFPIVHIIKTHFCWKIFEYQDHPTGKTLMQQYHCIFFKFWYMWVNWPILCSE